MWYKMPLAAEDGRFHFFEDFKLIRDRPLTDVWADTTTLYITVDDGADNQTPVLGKGTLIIRPQDFLCQLTTIRTINAPNLTQRVEAEASFARFFLGVLARNTEGFSERLGKP